MRVQSNSLFSSGGIRVINVAIKAVVQVHSDVIHHQEGQQKEVVSKSDHMEMEAVTVPLELYEVKDCLGFENVEFLGFFQEFEDVMVRIHPGLL